MSVCRHPYCDAEAVFRGLFCCTSCRVSYHQNHKVRLEALESHLVMERSGVDVLYSSAKPAQEQLRQIARELYRVAHGYVARDGDKPKEGFHTGSAEQAEMWESL